MQASCQCGQLHAHVADKAKPFTTLCHCKDCQRRSGSPFGVIAYFPQDAVTVEGEVREFNRTTNSGNRVTTGFCPSCGSTIQVLLSKNPDMIGVPLGAFADVCFPSPDIAVWEQDRHNWITLPEEMRCYKRGTDL